VGRTNGLLVIERILRDRDGVWEQIGEERDLGRIIRDMLFSSAAALACYGVVLGASNSDNPLLQAVVSAVKLPLLFLVTLAICLPTLYLFNLVFGARLQVRQALALVLVAITVIATLALAFAPISLFFLITANHYAFYKLLNVAILTLAAIVGLKFLTAGMAALNRHNAVRAAFAEAAAQAGADRPAGPSTAPATSTPDPAATLDGSAKPDTPPAPDTPATPDTPAAGAPAVPTVVPAPVPVGASAIPAAAGGGHVVAPVALAPGYTAGMAPANSGNGGLMVNPRMMVQPLPGARPEIPARPGAPVAERQASMTLLYVWILLFGFVGTQLAWTLRPFFGSPGERFELFRSIDGNFYVDIVRTLGHLF
jgi:hypothetical protein